MRDETHDPAATSWVASANEPDTDFPIQNLPFGLFRRHGSTDAPVAGVAIGARILPLTLVEPSCPAVSDVLALRRPARLDLRRKLHRLLRSDAPDAVQARLSPHLVPAGGAELFVPAPIGDYTDFFGSIYHALNASALMRPGAPLFAAYRHTPLAYHGRASSVVIDGTPIRRPHGPRRRRDAGPAYAATRRLDYEAEVGLLIGPGNRLGVPIPINRAWDHLAGVCLMNDWSARDIQAWESDPLGPFLGKSFATTVSPWIVTAEALAPFRVAQAPRTADDPALLPYLSSERDQADGALQIEVDVWLLTRAMREQGLEPVRISRSTSATQYWTPAQLVAHHTANGCNLRPGDLLGSGTLSGPDRDSWGCLLELTRGGREPIKLPSGESRAFLEDDDEVILHGRATAAGAKSIGFGECRGRVVPALPASEL